MAKIFQTILLVFLLNFHILGVVSDVDESTEELRPYYEYIQIYKSIPAIFEYLLNALEERPEILEKDDITAFKRSLGNGETDECDSVSEKKIDKRDAKCDAANEQDDHVGANLVNKRDTINPKDVKDTTEAHEYGTRIVHTKGLDETESNKAMTKRLANNGLINNSMNKEMKRELLKDENKVGLKKRNVLLKLDDDTNKMFQEFGEEFFGFEHLFGLDLKPEDIEERILTAQKLLEDYNNQKSHN